MSKFTVKRMFHVFRGEPTGEPLDTMSEEQLQASLKCSIVSESAVEKLWDDLRYYGVGNVELEQFKPKS
jgi:hypothetical protein